MCAIFGLLDYKGVLRHKKRLTLFRALSLAAQVRGTDATGAAWLERGEIHIQKAPKPAQRMRFRFPDEARAVIGHTRMTTQGPAEKNCNNHPFLGSAGKHQFALPHNGVISNEKALGWKYHFPVTQIETDSYVGSTEKTLYSPLGATKTVKTAKRDYPQKSAKATLPACGRHSWL